MNNNYETFDLEMSGEKIKLLLDFLANNEKQLEILIQKNPEIEKIILDINDIKNATTIDGGEY